MDVTSAANTTIATVVEPSLPSPDINEQVGMCEWETRPQDVVCWSSLANVPYEHICTMRSCVGIEFVE
ncbi:unnamed protein product [Clonostachys chloroleuca]|uniref:Uncharacterized protein n=1 Tax=Clonostachys chloroleuca TaxID=1926264 RepID=A0AA35M9C6_9HYPO|nr:unnamed protein product [Clonostachys chloroleuca]